MTERRLLVLAIVTDICDNEVTYPSCQQCYSKLFLDQLKENQRYHCLKCGWSCDPGAVQWRYRLVLSVADSQATGRVVVFGGTLNDFFGKSATDFHRSVQELSRSGYPAENIVMDALIKRFTGKYFYFGFKVAGITDQSQTVSLQDIFQTLTDTQTQHNSDTSHTLVYQMIANNDGVYATVVDHIRFALKALKKHRNINTGNVSNVNHSAEKKIYSEYQYCSHTESESETSSVCGISSLCAKQSSVRFSFEKSSSSSCKATGTSYANRNLTHQQNGNNSKDGSYLSETRNSFHRYTCKNNVNTRKSGTEQHKSEALEIQSPLLQRLDFNSPNNSNSMRTKNVGQISNLENQNHDTMMMSRSDESTSLVECKKVLSAYEFHRHLEPSCTQPTSYKPAEYYFGKSGLENSSFDSYLSRSSFQNDNSLVADQSCSLISNIEDVHVVQQRDQPTAQAICDNESVQNIYLPESEDLYEFLDSFEEEEDYEMKEDNLEPESLHLEPESLHLEPESLHLEPESLHLEPESLDISVPLNLPDNEGVTFCNETSYKCIDQANLCDLITIETDQKAKKGDFYTRQNENIASKDHSDQCSINNIGTSHSVTEDQNMMYLPESEDLEAFLNSFDESLVLSDSMCNAMAMPHALVMNENDDTKQSNVDITEKEHFRAVENNFKSKCEGNICQAVSANSVRRNNLMNVFNEVECENNLDIHPANRIQSKRLMNVSHQINCENDTDKHCETNDSRSLCLDKTDCDKLGEALEDDSGFSQSIDLIVQSDDDQYQPGSDLFKNRPNSMVNDNPIQTLKSQQPVDDRDKTIIVNTRDKSLSHNTSVQSIELQNCTSDRDIPNVVYARLDSLKDNSKHNLCSQDERCTKLIDTRATDHQSYCSDSNEWAVEYSQDSSQYLKHMNKKENLTENIDSPLGDVEKFFAEISLENGNSLGISLENAKLIENLHEKRNVEENPHENRDLVEISLRNIEEFAGDCDEKKTKLSTTDDEIKITKDSNCASIVKQSAGNVHKCRNKICWCQQFVNSDIDTTFSQNEPNHGKELVKVESLKTCFKRGELKTCDEREDLIACDSSHAFKSSILTTFLSPEMASNEEIFNHSLPTKPETLPHVFKSSLSRDSSSKGIASHEVEVFGNYTSKTEKLPCAINSSLSSAPKITVVEGTLNSKNSISTGSKTSDVCKNRDISLCDGDIAQSKHSQDLDQSADLFTDNSFYNQVTNTTEISQAIVDQTDTSVANAKNEETRVDQDVSDITSENMELIVESQNFNDTNEKSPPKSKENDPSSDSRVNKYISSPSVNLVRRVQFDHRLQKVSNCQLMDLKMKHNESPIENLAKTPLPKSCLKTTKKDNLVTKFKSFSPLAARHHMNVVYSNGNNGNYVICPNDHKYRNCVETTFEDGSQDLFGSSPIESKENSLKILIQEANILSIERVKDSSEVIYSFVGTPDLFDNTVDEKCKNNLGICADLSSFVGTPDLFENSLEKVCHSQPSSDPLTTPDSFSQFDSFQCPNSGRDKENVCDSSKVFRLFSNTNTHSSGRKSKTKRTGFVDIKDTSDACKNQARNLFKFLVEDTPSSKQSVPLCSLDGVSSINRKNKTLKWKGENDKRVSTSKHDSENRAVLRAIDVNTSMQESQDLFGSPLFQSCDSLNDACILDEEGAESPLCKKLFF